MAFDLRLIRQMYPVIFPAGFPETGNLYPRIRGYAVFTMLSTAEHNELLSLPEDDAVEIGVGRFYYALQFLHRAE